VRGRAGRVIGAVSRVHGPSILPGGMVGRGSRRSDVALVVDDCHTGGVDGCEHLSEINEVTPSADGCEDCLRIGGWWLHLRLCLTCGHVGCCDESPNRHASGHFRATGHLVIRSFEPDEAWLWCFVDEIGFDPTDPRPA